MGTAGLRPVRANRALVAIDHHEEIAYSNAAINAVNASGYLGLNTTAKTLRDAGMVYNCLDLAGTARTTCQATLAQPYQQKGLLQDAMKAASGRLSQISDLMTQIDATADQKAVQEIQARIGAIASRNSGAESAALVGRGRSGAAAAPRTSEDGTLCLRLGTILARLPVHLRFL